MTAGNRRRDSTRWKGGSWAVVLASCLLAAPAAQACSLCHSPEARELRHEVFEHGFWKNLMSIVLPLPLLLGTIWLAGMERPRNTPLRKNDERT